MKRLQIFGRLALGAIAAISCWIASPAAVAQTVSINGTNTSCAQGSTNLSVAPNGNITITCTVSGATVFSCTAPTVSSASIASGSSQTSTITFDPATCVNGSVMGVAWQIPNGISLTSGSSTTNAITIAAPTISSTATYNFPITVTPNGGGTPWTNNSAAVSVTVTSSGGSGGSGGTGGTGGTGCVSSNSAITQTATLTPKFFQQTVSLQAGQIATFTVAAPYTMAAPPTYPAARTGGYFNAVQSTGSVNTGLGTQFAVSTCAGDFTDNVPAGCTTWGTPEGGMMLPFGVGAPGPLSASCILQPNTTYYLNVRMVTQNGTTSCPVGACQEIIQIH